MSKNPFILTLGLLFFLSCKKDGTDTPVDHSYVKTITTTATWLQGSNVRTYSYNGDGLVKELTSSVGSRTEYEYQAGFNLEKGYGTDGKLGHTNKVFLDANNHIDSILLYNEDTVVARFLYTYHADSVTVLSVLPDNIVFQTIMNTANEWYYDQVGLYTSTRYFRGTRIAKTNMGAFTYGLPSENKFLIDSSILRYGFSSLYPDSEVVYRYSYVIDSMDRVLEKSTTENGQFYQKEVYTYY